MPNKIYSKSVAIWWDEQREKDSKLFSSFYSFDEFIGYLTHRNMPDIPKIWRILCKIMIIKARTDAFDKRGVFTRAHCIHNLRKRRTR